MPRKLSLMLRSARFRKKGVIHLATDHRRLRQDEILEREFAKWLRVREPQLLCEMFGEQLADKFGLDRSLFLYLEGKDALPESLYSRGITSETAQNVLAHPPMPGELPGNGAGRANVEPCNIDTMTQQFSLSIDPKRGTRVIGLIGTKNNRRLQRRQLQRLELWLSRFELALENQERIARLEALSYTDSLTGIFNRRFFKRRLEEEITRAQRFSRCLSLVVFDLDRFKQLNDRYGHLRGDRVLREVSGLLTATVRSIDIACRYGGDEFVIIMPETSLPNCFSFTNRLRHVIFEHVFRTGPQQDAVRLSISLGAAVFPDHADDSERLFWCADMALLKAKDGGGDRAVVYQPGMDTVPSSNDHRE
ncbi:diguanylate cyclase [Candidatus Zixiibacteriota bacterium]